MKLKSSGKITHEVTLTGRDIIDLLSNYGTNYTAGKNATVEFKVPGGGDYSSCEVDFTTEERVVVRWEETTNEE